MSDDFCVYSLVCVKNRGLLDPRCSQCFIIIIKHKIGAAEFHEAPIILVHD